MSRLDSAYSKTRLLSAKTTALDEYRPQTQPSFDIMKSNPTIKRGKDRQLEVFENMDSIDGYERSAY